MTRSTHPDVKSPGRRFRLAVAGIQAAVVALVAFAAVTAPTADARPSEKLRQSFVIERLDIYDSFLSNACGTTVTAVISGDQERKIVLGKNGRVAARENKTFDGQIQWYSEATGKSYSSRLKNKSEIEYPQGIELFLPAHVTVTGSNGGTFPVDDGPPGHGKFEYDAVIYAIDDEGFPYHFVDGEPTWTGPQFDKATARICAALA